MNNYKLIATCITLSTCAYGGGDIAPTQPWVDIPIISDWIENPLEGKDGFVYIAGGYAFLDVTSHVVSGSEISASALDNQGALMEIGVGLMLTENVFATLSGQSTSLDEVMIYNVFGSINYQLSNFILKPYVGVLAGYSSLSWNTRPHEANITPASENLNSTAAVFGIQAGIEQELNEDWSLFAKYQYLTYDNHSMNINKATTIEHNSAQNILGGIRYAF